VRRRPAVHCSGCGIPLTRADGRSGECLDCQVISELAVDEATGAPLHLRSALAERLETARAAVVSHDLGDQGVALFDLGCVLREAVGEISDPLLSELGKGRDLGRWLHPVQRAADIAGQTLRALSWLGGEPAGLRIGLDNRETVGSVCERGGFAFEMTDRALIAACRAAERAPAECEAALERARAGIHALGACLRWLEVRCREAPTLGDLVSERCERCGEEFRVERRRGQAAGHCPTCRLLTAVRSRVSDPETVRELAGALRARGDQVSAADVDLVWRCLGVDLFTAQVAQPAPQAQLPDGSSPFCSQAYRGPSEPRPRLVGRHSRRLPRVAVETEDAARYLRVAGRDRLWWLGFEDLEVAERVARGRAAGGDAAALAFLEEAKLVRNLRLPAGHRFGEEDGEPVPSLMQRLAAVRVRRDRRIGWFTETGTGKTLAAVLASRVVGSRLTLVLCPNQTVYQWAHTVRRAFPGCSVVAKQGAPPPLHKQGRYLIVNWEALQEAGRFEALRRALRGSPPDMIVLDEIHAAKQRDERVLSLRRQRTAQLLGEVDGWTEGRLRVLGMSATPVLNALREGRALIELIEGRERPDLLEAPTQANCLALHRAITLTGLVWAPPRPALEPVRHVRVAAERQVQRFLRLPDGQRTVPGLERLLVGAKLATLRSEVRRGTLVYSSLVEGIVPVMVRALERDGWRVGVCTGDDHSGLEAFRQGAVDVLVGSAAVSLGVDGLQHVADRVIAMVLPWTQAELHQLTGRLNRPGQMSSQVEVIVPVARVRIDGQEWSWCERRLQLLARKQALSQAVTAGRVEAVDETAAQRLLGRALAELCVLGQREAA
jgi:superfamily II DNA or RNA helicase